MSIRLPIWRALGIVLPDARHDCATRIRQSKVCSRVSCQIPGVPLMSGMLKQLLIGMVLLAPELKAAEADTLQLKDKAAITGKILAEKHDQVVVDVGYTVLVIPRNQIVKIYKASEGPAGKSTIVANTPPLS